jgi:hypothetical protein
MTISGKVNFRYVFISSQLNSGIASLIRWI